MTITDMVPAMLDGRLKGLFVIGENPKLSDPDWNHLNQALKKLDFLVVQDLFLSETAQVADVVASAAAVAEKEGTFTNTERRCMRIHKAVEPVGQRPGRLGDHQPPVHGHGIPMDYDNPQAIFDEMAALTPKSYAGMTYERLGLDGLQWPCPDRDHPGTPYLHKDLRPRQWKIPRHRLPGPGGNARCGLSLFPDHGPHVRPFPYRHHDPHLSSPGCGTDHRLCFHQPG
jgi:predicted molibdopterin-dependent oxidoreductase YjgC